MHLSAYISILHHYINCKAQHELSNTISVLPKDHPIVYIKDVNLGPVTFNPDKSASLD